MEENDVSELKRELIDSLSALASMWNQYCPPPAGHACMSSGEEAEEVLDHWGLMRPDGSAIELNWDKPESGKALTLFDD